MELIDVFNGDADGICALHQLRLAEPAESVLVTGVKRDIHLLERLPDTRDASLTVLDISLDANRDALLALLERGCRIRYFDHHYAGDIPQHPQLTAHIDLAATVCTSLLVDRELDGAHRPWAVVAAFGDNLQQPAREAARDLDCSESDLADLCTLGELLNYNGYGADLSDLHFPPDALYRALRPYEHPLAFFREAAQAQKLHAGFESDLSAAQKLQPLLESTEVRVARFPAEPWARRIMGVYANRAANDAPGRATAIVVDNDDGSLRVSVRAPKNNPRGAEDLCRQFPTGGGRAGAAGINFLPPEQLSAFLAAFESAYGDGTA